MRILGRRMRMVTIPNQSSIPKAFLEGDSDGRLPDAALYHWIVDVMEQLVTFTWPCAAALHIWWTVTLNGSKPTLRPSCGW
jgi:hypothetical protein